MIKLYKKRNRFYQCADYTYSYYKTVSANNIIITSGALNHIWNQWNSFWRSYFMLYAIGGYDCHNIKVGGFYNTLRQNQVACFYQRIKANQRYTLGNDIPFYRELTWGDPDVIVDLLSSSSVTIPNSSYVIGLITMYKNEISDFQKIRNSFVHMNNMILNDMKRVVLPRYRLNRNQKIIEILYATSLNTGGECFRTLVDSLKSCLSYI